ncbi:MarR family winged helix-turn-helix transcriptional regulator [Viridibacterium curvum]|uniref:HTH marR-type domain-containing protein n=1 Tax=Viridibacterium curvum TaxID=1101404 RepID=A0ABP9QZX0_9RHOO
MAAKPSRRDAEILREAMRLFMYEQRRLLADLDVPQARMLIVLLRRAPLLQSELGRLLALEKSWVSRAVDKLVALGWVTRNALPEDRRAVQLTLSPAGLRAAREVDEQMNAHAESVLSRLPRETRSQVMPALQALCDALHEGGERGADQT